MSPLDLRLTSYGHFSSSVLGSCIFFSQLIIYFDTETEVQVRYSTLIWVLHSSFNSLLTLLTPFSLLYCRSSRKPMRPTSRSNPASARTHGGSHSSELAFTLLRSVMDLVSPAPPPSHPIHISPPLKCHFSSIPHPFSVLI